MKLAKFEKAFSGISKPTNCLMPGNHAISIWGSRLTKTDVGPCPFLRRMKQFKTFLMNPNSRDYYLTRMSKLCNTSATLEFPNSSFSEAIMYHKALKTAMFRNLFITIGPSIFSFSSSINFRTSSCKDSSIVDLPNPKSLRFLKRNLLYSCQYFPYEKECNLQSVKMFLSYLLYLA